jgi:hypothetical protein
MKTLSAILLSLFAISAFASELTSKVRDIEAERNAKCEEIKRSVRLCYGGVPGGHQDAGPINNFLNTCHYTVTYDCDSNEGGFIMKVRVKEKFNSRTQRREANAGKVSIKE